MSSFLLLFFLITKTYSLYWFFDPGNEKCFIQPISQETLVVALYKSLHHSELHSSQKISVTIYDPFGAKIYSEYLDKEEGRIVFVSEFEGNHKMCFFINKLTESYGNIENINNKKRFGIEIHIDIDHEAHDYESLARREHLSEMEAEINRLMDYVKSIKKEQTYQKKKEEEFRSTSEQINTNIIYWSIFQMTILCILTIIQVFHLKKFFQKKKLV